jgi:hypothetical protein
MHVILGIRRYYGFVVIFPALLDPRDEAREVLCREACYEFVSIAGRIRYLAS